MNPTDRLFSRTFRALGSEVKVLLRTRRPDDATKAFGDVSHLFERCEKRLSRFRDDSELSDLNRSQGRAFKASPVLFSSVHAALRAAEESGGVFDPTVIDILERYGYDRPFEEVQPPPHPVQPSPVAGRYRAIRLDPSQHTITLPEGVRIELGGIGKGWLVDEAQRLLAPYGNALIDAGGDIAVLGDAPGHRGWLVGVENPLRPDEDVARLRLRNRAVATSSTMRRRWGGNGDFHHVIDPRSGAPARSDVVAATVVSSRARDADVEAKVALILGAAEGKRYLERRHPQSAGILIRENGEPVRSRGFERYEDRGAQLG